MIKLHLYIQNCWEWALCICIYPCICISSGCHYSHFGGAKNGTSVARIKILRPLLIDQTSPQKDTLGTQIGPQKVIFGHFIDFEYFGSNFSCFYIVKEIKTSNGHTRIVYKWVYNAEIFLWAPNTQPHHISRMQDVTQKKLFCGTP